MLQKLRRLFHSLFPVLLAILSVSITGCVYQDPADDCVETYRVRFRFDKNILHADAFAQQVTVVHLNVYTPDGVLVWNGISHRKTSADNDFYMDIPVRPGTYDLVAWCEGESVTANPISFGIGEGTALADFTASLPLIGTSPSLSSPYDINPLFHGLLSEVEFPEGYSVHEVGTISLTKDTNHLVVLLQNVDGTPIDPNLIKFEITADNNILSYTNLVSPSSTDFVYRPWHKSPTDATFDKPDASPLPSFRAEGDFYSGVLAELTTSRLMADKEQRLIVTRTDTGKKILDIPLIKYLLLVKNKYDEPYTNQEYLDYIDTYTLMFFINEGMVWQKAQIYINGWRAVPPQDTEL